MTHVSEAVWLMRLSRWSAWVALAMVALFVVTGYGMTKRVIDPDLGKYLHTKVLPIPLFVSLVLHSGLCARGALHRWHVFKGRLTADLYVLAAGLVLLALFLWMYLS